MLTPSIAGIVRAARDGDVEARAELYRRFAGVVHGIVLSYVAFAEADDLTQDVFETVLTRLSELRDDEAFPGWIVTIARRRALNAVRRHPGEGAVDADWPSTAASPDVETEAEQALAAIRRLPAAYRETLMLRLVEGLTGPEIAERTGLGEGSVRVNLHRGMQQLRTSLRISARPGDAHAQ